MILRVYIKDRVGGPLEFEDCRALRDGARILVVDVATREIVERIRAEDVERVHHVGTPGDGTE